MSVSNKTLAVLLLAAIVVSLGGTFISLNRLGTISPTGYSTGEGTVNLSINATLSITTEDSDLLDFGVCNLGPASAGITINSQGGEDTTTACTNPGSLTPISVRNDGNVDANVTIKSNKVGTQRTGDTFIPTGSTDSDLLFLVQNDSDDASYSGGCMGTLGSPTYTAFLDTAAEYNVCNNLQAHGTANSVQAHFQIVVPTAAQEGDTVTVTFTATDDT